MSEEAHPLTPAALRRVDGPFVVLQYDTDRWPFAPVMCDLLGVASFSQLPIGDPSQRAAAAEVNREFRRSLAQTPLDHPIYDLYRRFVADGLAPLFGPRIPHTERPVLRVQIAQSPSISAPHRDVDYTQRWDYINAWVPLLDVPEEVALRVETQYASGVMTSHPARYGEVLLFDGGALEHFSPANPTMTPRVSIDFRFAPKQSSALSRRILSARPADVQDRHRASQA